MRLSYTASRPTIIIEDRKASAYYQRARVTRTAAIALLETDLRVRWSNGMFSEVVTCGGNEPTQAGMARFLTASALREQVLDVLTSGGRKETFVSLPNHITRQYWRGVVFGCQKNRPKNVVLILQPCVALIRFESDTGYINWRNEQGLHKLGYLHSCETGRQVWAAQPFRQIDWSELVVKELESPLGTCSGAVEIGGSGREKHKIRFVAGTRQ